MPENQLREVIELMKKETNKTCVSLIVPLYGQLSEQKTKSLQLEKAVQNACHQIELSFPAESAFLIKSLNEIYHKIELNAGMEGIGIFISENVQYRTTFHFEVKQKLVISDSFHMNELLYQQQYNIPYLFLHVGEKMARLYSGHLQQLEEIENEDFPLAHDVAYEYQPPSRSTSYAGSTHLKSFEVDKDSMVKKRTESFLHLADERLANYLNHEKLIILSGVKRYTSAFLNRTIYGDKIIGIVNGNFDDLNTSGLAAITWPAVKAYVLRKMQDDISDFEEKIGEGLAKTGIVDAWEAIAENRGLKLLIEKDFHIQAYLEKQLVYQLFLDPPKFENMVLPNAVDNLVEMMFAKKGDVVFVENGMLSKYQHIALIARF